MEAEWAASLTEGRSPANVAMCETRTFNGRALVERCRLAWEEGRAARLDFPQSDGERAEVEIVAARWDKTPDGQKLILWVRIEDLEEFEQDNLDLF